MGKKNIPQEIVQLLEPIAKKEPTGTDPEMSPNYINLEAELNKMGDINYQEIINWAQQIFETESKHLRVAAWLSLAWLRIEGFSGFRKGLILILELLKKYKDKLFPESPAQRSKAIQYLNSEKRFQIFIQKLEVTNENVNEISESESIFQQISD